jgi:uncharacterized membrane protein YtjA (UPF0391 family)
VEDGGMTHPDFYPIVFLVVAVMSGVLGFTQYGLAADVAKVFFLVFLALFLIALALNRPRK